MYLEENFLRTFFAPFLDNSSWHLKGSVLLRVEYIIKRNVYITTKRHIEKDGHVTCPYTAKRSTVSRFLQPDIRNIGSA